MGIGNSQTGRSGAEFEIQSLVNSNCVVVFSKRNCIYCKRVKKLFNDSNINYTIVELDERKDGNSLQTALYEITGSNTVPRVFVNGECIGGASETEALSKQNKLMEKINLCSL